MGKGGESTSSVEGDILVKDPRFRPFLSDAFAAADFASQVLADPQSTAQAQTSELQEGIRLLNVKLRREVVQRYDELLRQAGKVRELEHAMQGINTSVEALQLTLQRVRSDITEPHQQVRLKTQQLHNLHSTVDLLRHVINRLKLTQKLRQQMQSQTGGTIDLAKAAKLLTDIEALGGEAVLEGVEVIDADVELLRNAGEQAALRQGLDMLSQAEVGSALQVYFNLQELPEAVDALLSQYTGNLARTVSAALDPRKLAPTTAGTGPAAVKPPSAGTGPGQKWQEALWQRLGKAAEQARTALVAAWHLQRVLAKKRDPLTHVAFSDVLAQRRGGGGASPTERVWTELVALLTEALARAANPAKGGFVREALIQGYPRLACLLEDCCSRLQQDSQVKGVPPAVDPEREHELVDGAAPFQQAYLAGCLSRLTDAVNAAFAGGARPLPTSAELQKCIGRLHEELRAVGDRPRLAGAVAGQVGVALHLLAERAAYMAATGPEVRAVSGACSSGQLRNISLASRLQEVHSSLANLFPRLPPPAVAALQAPADAMRAVALETTMPLFRGLAEAAEAAILGMHEEPGFGKDGAGTVMESSPYMVDLTRIISHARSEFLSRFSPAPSGSVPTFAGALVERLACRILVFFVRHASLLRPLTHQGKLQLAKDMADLEVAVGQNLVALDHLGAPYRIMRAFRPLLFLETVAIDTSPLLREIPAPNVLHHLYSRAPSQLQAPHTLRNVSPAKYSLWMDQHSCKEVVKQVQSSLQSVSRSNKDAPGVAEVLPVMSRICASALAGS